MVPATAAVVGTAKTVAACGGPDGVVAAVAPTTGAGVVAGGAVGGGVVGVPWAVAERPTTSPPTATATTYHIRIYVPTRVPLRRLTEAGR